MRLLSPALTATAAADTALAGALWKPALFDRAVGAGLQPEHFYAESHAAVFGSMLRLFAAGTAPTHRAVRADLQERGSYELATSAATLATQGISVEPEEFEAAVEALLQSSRLRKAHAAASDLLAYDGPLLSDGLGYDDRMEGVDTALAGLSASIAERAASSAPIAEEAAGLLRDYDLAASGQYERRTLSGIRALDAIARGMPKGRVTLVAARSSHGKTAWTAELVRRIAKRDEEAMAAGAAPRAALVFTAEMARRDYARRLACAEAEVDSQAVSAGDLDQHGQDRYFAAVRRLAALPIVIDDEASPTTAYMGARIAHLRHDGKPAKPSVVVFDYLEYTGEKHENKGLRLEAALQGCHALAKRFDCPVVVVHQVNREMDNDKRQSPRLSDLGWTDAAVKIPSLIVMLYHPWVHFTQMGKPEGWEPPPRDAFNCHVLKNTDGKLGQFSMRIAEGLAFHDVTAASVPSFATPAPF